MAEPKLETLGRYKILEVLGRGAMGVVYKAVDPVIDRVVAITTINLSLSKDEIAEYEARFQQEIKAAGRFSHPNIVTIYDVGRTDEVAYMAMEFLNGRELKDILATGARLEVDTTVELMLQVADGLAYAHEHGIVHRDIKPSNIMVIDLPNGVFSKITDFGIARMPGSAVKTMTGVVLGSPRYMSPEQVVGKEIDHRSDIFSLGVVLYETLTGTAPFDGATLTGIMYATVNTHPAPPSAANPASPKMLDLVLEKALAKEVDRRYQSMREFHNDLREVRRLLVGGTGTRPLPRLDVLLAKQPPAAVPPPPAPSAAGAATIITGHQRKFDADEEVERPLQISKAFDSFNATVKLAALTQQTSEFSDYISTTQKMRAYGNAPGAGAPSASGAPAPQPPAAGSAPTPAAASRTGPVTIPRGDITGSQRMQAYRGLPILPMVVLTLLSLGVIALLIATLFR
jgi:serine/threonine-protein kinase